MDPTGTLPKETKPDPPSASGAESFKKSDSTGHAGRGSGALRDEYEGEAAQNSSGPPPAPLLSHHTNSDTAIRDKTAVLYKQGRGRNRWWRRPWARRTFVLEGNFLIYFKPAKNQRGGTIEKRKVCDCVR